MTTIRETARNIVLEQIDINLFKKMHEPQYWTLYINPDGSLFWYEHAIRNEFIQDPDFEEETPLGSVVTVGTGDRPCACDYCEAADENRGNEIMDEFRTKNQDRITAVILKQFDENATLGYFYDEETEDP